MSRENPLASGDPAAWNALIQAVHPDAILVLIGYRMGTDVRCRTEPEDILQETLLRAWRGRHDFAWQGVASFRRWLIRIAERCIEDERDRAHAKKRDVAATRSLGLAAPGAATLADAPAVDPWTSTTPSRIAEMRERARAMETALQALTPDVREVVRMRLFEDLAIDEIAERLGLGESAVRHRFRKGAEEYRNRLRSALASSTAVSGGAPERDAHPAPVQRKESVPDAGRDGPAA
jgi:RNA polymerase sigma-70 factor (ECF subfamily)